MNACHACSADIDSDRCPVCNSSVCFTSTIPGSLRCGNTNEAIPEEWPHLAGCEAWCQRCEGTGAVYYPPAAPGADVIEDCPACAGTGTRAASERSSTP